MDGGAWGAEKVRSAQRWNSCDKSVTLQKEKREVMKRYARKESDYE
jgi:hypothetical protein